MPVSLVPIPFASCTDCDYDGREENDAFFGFDPIDRESIDAPPATLTKEGVYQCKKHGSTSAYYSYPRHDCTLPIYRSPMLLPFPTSHLLPHFSLASLTLPSPPLPVSVLPVSVLPVSVLPVSVPSSPNPLPRVLFIVPLLDYLLAAKTHANTPHAAACNQCYGWKKQIARLRAAEKKAGKK
ncbi:hypothetical protein K438DRAFT_1995444 [Mycena galopus ATCC 62051]|nr:hypothetical protein K438DRAFT_1995444 [Mycena galopus ATCC 62051]